MPELVQDRNINQPRDIVAPPPVLPSERVHEEEVSAEVVAGGSLLEAACGIGGLVLAIVGLAGVIPVWLAAIAAIVLGAGLLLEAAAFGARFSKLMSEMVGARLSLAELGGGVTAEFLAGGAGIVLGILALIGIVPGILEAVIAIVFGAALILGAGATAGLNKMLVEHHCRGHEMARRVATAMVSASNGAQVLAGLAAIILGIIGLTSVYGMTLSLIAFLVVGAAMAISDLALSGKMIEMVRR
jgi:hypothetical protein